LSEPPAVAGGFLFDPDEPIFECNRPLPQMVLTPL
jgi:hypothetical protein